ncbi:hypothetical protein PSTG_11739 [Puccinia striiformis f. sp. tritici PST-78]|uniref:Uncharacterized protein n=1 Tax=Puccinia striiformis f. sp. tritici PST-78 TaxID=1165861 RepID=A0A0L0V6P4_9BASI|nr:hypothetical protein PSTG_11739 [Puccinia striiformis f. sp. tritici PST-78]
MENGSQIDPSLSQAPSPLASALLPLQSTATDSVLTLSPSKPKQTGKKGAQRKAGPKAKQPSYHVTRLQLVQGKKDHRQAIHDMMKDQDDPPPTKVTRARAAKSAKASPNEDGGKHFVRTDFENICTYLKTAQHFTDLFGDGSKTAISAAKQSKVKAFNFFAVWMNQRNGSLQLNGRQLQQRFTTYKNKYMAAKHQEDGTGGGVEEQDGNKSLAEVLEDMCPCFEWIDAIFREKANVTPMFEFDHSMIDARVDVGNSDSSDEEIFFDGWEPTQSQAPKARTQSLGGSGAAPTTDLDVDDDFNMNSTLPDLAELFGGSGPARSPMPPPSAAQSPSRGPRPPLPASAPATMLNPPVPSAPVGHDPNARGSNAPDPKSKMSLASSFAQANERKFDILDKQIATESRRWEEAEARAERERDREANRLASENALMDKRLNLEGARLKRQDDLEVARAAAAIAKEDSLRAQKKAMVDQMLQAGSSAPEIAALVQLVYGSG